MFNRKNYSIEDLMTVREKAFRKAVGDIRVTFSGFTLGQIRAMMDKMSIVTIIDYVDNGVFPFDFEQFRRQQSQQQIKTATTKDQYTII